VLYALSSHGEDVDKFRAMVLGVLFPGSLATIAALLIGGLIDRDVLIACLAAALPMIAGTFTGAWLRRRVSPAAFRLVVLLVLLGSSAFVLVSALAL
jgi:uncharacterized membrane protein YfcA